MDLTYITKVGDLSSQTKMSLAEKARDSKGGKLLYLPSCSALSLFIIYIRKI